MDQKSESWAAAMGTIFGVHPAPSGLCNPTMLYIPQPTKQTYQLGGCVQTQMPVKYIVHSTQSPGYFELDVK